MKLEDKLYTVKFKAHTDPHIVIKDKDTCNNKCKEKHCLMCPAKNFVLEENNIVFSYDSCFECGTCRIVCPHNNLTWDYPFGGFGVSYKFG